MTETLETKEAFAPGVHLNVPAVEYHKWDFVSASRLKAMRRSPLHCRYSIDHPKESDAMEFGEAFHTLLLQPELFKDRYAVRTFSDGRSAAAKAELEAIESAGQIALKAESHAGLLAMRDNVRALAKAHALVRSVPKDDVELSVTWIDAPTGLKCKMRADAVSRRFATAIDIKTTRDASGDKFEKAILEFGYAIQAAFYLRGLATAGIDAKRFVFIAVESEPPYAAAAYELDEESLKIGAMEADELLADYARCVRENRWPGYPNHITSIGLPQWFIKQWSNKL